MRIRLRKVIDIDLLKMQEYENRTRVGSANKAIVDELVRILAEEFREHIAKIYTMELDYLTGNKVFSCDLNLVSTAEMDAIYRNVEYKAQREAVNAMNAVLSSKAVTDDYGNLVGGESIRNWEEARLCYSR